MKKVILGLAFVAAVLVSCDGKKKEELDNKVDSLEVKTEEAIDTAAAKLENAVDSTQAKAGEALEKSAEKLEEAAGKMKEAAKK
jgi:cell division protein ZapA (FtsZ GTPase activity inhibitor)